MITRCTFTQQLINTHTESNFKYGPYQNKLSLMPDKSNKCKTKDIYFIYFKRELGNKNSK